MARLHHVALRPIAVEQQVSFAKDVRTRTTLPKKSAGRGLSLRDDGRMRAIARCVSSGHAEPPGISASGIHRGA